LACIEVIYLGRLLVFGCRQAREVFALPAAVGFVPDFAGSTRIKSAMAFK